MQIDIDFEVYKALTMLRQSEGDSYNAVLRRLLNLNSANALAGYSTAGVASQNALAPAAGIGTKMNSLLRTLEKSGAWFDNIHFPNGTQFQAIYKGEKYTAHIVDSHWVDSNGIVRSSPSAAASAISGTNVNGWKFWHCKLPGEHEWRRIDELKS